jgi:hypothetical protein
MSASSVFPTVLSFTTSRSSRLAMKILNEMTPENYDRFLSKLSEASASYTLLKNGVVTGGSAKENRIIEIACEMFEAKMLLKVSQILLPWVLTVFLVTLAYLLPVAVGVSADTRWSEWKKGYLISTDSTHVSASVIFATS